MPLRRVGSVVMLSGEELETLRLWAERPTASRGLARRARLTLASAAGQSEVIAAGRPGLNDPAMGKWRDWYSAKGCDRLSDRPRSGASQDPDLGARLNSREREVLSLLSQGRSNKSIASTLGVSKSTVNYHLKSILEKLHLEDRVQAAIFAVCHGMGEQPARSSL